MVGQVIYQCRSRPRYSASDEKRAVARVVRARGGTQRDGTWRRADAAPADRRAHRDDRGRRTGTVPAHRIHAPADQTRERLASIDTHAIIVLPHFAMLFVTGKPDAEGRRPAGGRARSPDRPRSSTCDYHTAETAPQPLLVTMDDTNPYVLDPEVGRALASSTRGQRAVLQLCQHAR
jgi:hypothetical protein